MNIHKDALFACLVDFAKIYEEWEQHNRDHVHQTGKHKGKLILF